MVDQLTRSNLDIFNDSTIDDSGGVEPLSNLDLSSHQSNLMGTDLTSDLTTVSETLQGLVQESGVHAVFSQKKHPQISVG
ncbi:hypothetical protein [Crocosphaera sp.]|uniref:hypothetical protein n=1 Tax=Crocosphaera sp. TaxID=2729996 RepID=UPI003F28BF2B|nr:hypothetical protein [Crocosphaera sp.]